MPGEKRLPRQLGANGVVGRVADGKGGVPEAAAEFEVIEEGGRRCRAIAEHQGRYGTVIRPNPGPAGGDAVASHRRDAAAARIALPKRARKAVARPRWLTA